MSEKRHRLSAGRYSYRGRVIVRTEWEREGSRGGTRYLWELGKHDPDAGVVLDGYEGFRTLREAMRAVDVEVESADS